jgi:hypothetical protein
MDAHPKVVKLAEALPQEAWKPLERLARYEIATENRDASLSGSRRQLCALRAI